MAKSTKPLVPTDFPEFVAGKQRIHELQSEAYAAHQRAVALASESHAPVAVAREQLVGALVSGAAIPESFELDTNAGRVHASRVQEAEDRASILHRAHERYESEFNTLHGEISNQCLRARKGEIHAAQRAQIALALRLVQARDGERALRSQMERDEIRGAETAWSLSIGFAVDQLGHVDEPDSALWNMLREAESTGALTAKEVADIRTGRPFNA